MNHQELKSLKLGDIVRNEGSGNSYIVIDTSTGTPIVCRTITMCNPSEWTLVKQPSSVSMADKLTMK